MEGQPGDIPLRVPVQRCWLGAEFEGYVNCRRNRTITGGSAGSMVNGGVSDMVHLCVAERGNRVRYRKGGV